MSPNAKYRDGQRKKPGGGPDLTIRTRTGPFVAPEQVRRKIVRKAITHSYHRSQRDFKNTPTSAGSDSSPGLEKCVQRKDVMFTCSQTLQLLGDLPSFVGVVLLHLRGQLVGLVA